MIIKHWLVSLSVCALSLFTSAGAFAGRSAAIDGDASTALALFYQQNAIHQARHRQAGQSLSYSSMICSSSSRVPQIIW